MKQTHESPYKLSGPVMEALFHEWVRLGNLAAIAQAMPTLKVAELAGVLAGRLTLREGNATPHGLTYTVDQVPQCEDAKESPER